MRKLCLLSALILVGCGGNDANISDDGGDGGGGSDANGGGDGAADTGSNDTGTMDSGGNDGSLSDSGGGDSGDGGIVYPGRMFVSMEGNATAVWDNASSLSMDVAPTFTLTDSSVTNGSRGLALANKRLFVGTAQSAGVLLAFDNANSLAANAAPAAKVPLANFILPVNAVVGTDLIQWNSKTDTLWVSGSSNGTELFTGAASITSSSKAKADFTHQFQQLPAFVYDEMGDHAIAGQISGAGVLEWNSASSASGSPAVSFTLDKGAADWSLSIEKDRLYGIGHYSSPEVIAVWKSISGVSMSKVPDFTMGTASGIATNDFSPFVSVQNDVLIACIQSGKVLVWTGASALSGEKMPTQTITTGNLQNPRRAFFGPVTGRLYVLDDKGVAIYSNPTTSPALVAKIVTGMKNPRDFVVIE
jgi:hypothetical protein